MRRSILSALLAVATAVMLALPALAVCLTPGCGHHGAAEAQRDTRVHECPMACVKPGESHPYTQVGPGDCPVCGMHLVPSATQPAPTKN